MAKQEDKMSAEAVVKHIRRETRRKHSAEEKIRIVLEGIRGEASIAVVALRSLIFHLLTVFYLLFIPKSTNYR